MTRDENDRLREGTLPEDPRADAKRVSEDVPRVLTVRDIMDSAMRHALDTRSGSVCTSGHYRIDDITGGLRAGFVWVFGADTGYGKSSWCVMVADENIKRGKRVLIVSAEDDEKLYGSRLLVRRSRVSADALRRRRLTAEDQNRLALARESGEDVPVFLDARGKNVEWIARHTKQLVAEHRIDLIAYDYLQAFDNEKPQQDRRNQVSYIARTLVDAAKTSGVAAVLFSQLTVQEGKPIPDKHSIRESRDVSNMAEVVAIGFTPRADVVDSEKRTLARANERTLLLDKVKDGPRGAMIALPWDEASACFDTVADPEVQRYEQQIRENDSMTDDFAERYP